MANRYLRANGSWNDSVWSDVPNGAAGSASTPTSADTVVIANNFTLNLNSDIEINGFNQSAGTFKTNGYKVTSSASLSITGSSAKTFDIRGSHIIHSGAYWNGGLTIDGSGDTILHEGSTIEIIVRKASATVGAHALLGLNGRSLNRVIVRSTTQWSSSHTGMRIEGSGSIDTLAVIISDPTPASLVLFQDLTIRHFIAVGYSTSSRLSVRANDFPINIDPAWSNQANGYIGSCYGENLNIESVDFAYGEVDWGYIGSTSVTSDTVGWTNSQAPKISTFNDNLTVAPASNSNWMYPGTALPRFDNPSYFIDNDPTQDNYTQMVSTNAYDLVDGTLSMRLGADETLSELKIIELANRFTIEQTYAYIGYRYGSETPVHLDDQDEYEYVKIQIESSPQRLTIGFSKDGTDWISATVANLDDIDILMMRSARIWIDPVAVFSYGVIHEVNPVLGTPYTLNPSDSQSVSDSVRRRAGKLFTELIAPSDDQTINHAQNNRPVATQETPDDVLFHTASPKLIFKAVDPEGNDVHYQIEILEEI